MGIVYLMLIGRCPAPLSAKTGQVALALEAGTLGMAFELYFDPDDTVLSSRCRVLCALLRPAPWNLMV